MNEGRQKKRCNNAGNAHYQPFERSRSIDRLKYLNKSYDRKRMYGDNAQHKLRKPLGGFALLVKVFVEKSLEKETKTHACHWFP